MYTFEKGCENANCCTNHFKRVYNSDYIYKDMEDRRMDYNCLGKCCKTDNRGTLPPHQRQLLQQEMEKSGQSNNTYDRYRPGTPAKDSGRSLTPGPYGNRQQQQQTKGFGKSRREAGGGPAEPRGGSGARQSMFGMQQNTGPFGQCEEHLYENREKRKEKLKPDCEGKQPNPQIAKKPTTKDTDICPRCHNPVFYAERHRGAGHSWHTRCFICGDCGKQLSSSCFAERNSTDVYCFPCYNRLFGPVGYGFGVQSTLRMRDNPECENDDVVKNCTCCRNTLDPGLLCVRQHLRPTDTKELNACNCFCNDDDEDIPPPPSPKSQQQQQFQPPNKRPGPPGQPSVGANQRANRNDTGECSCERQMLALNIRKNALEKGSRGPDTDTCNRSFRDEYFKS